MPKIGGRSLHFLKAGHAREEDFAELSDERFRDGVSPRSHFAAMCGGGGGCRNLETSCSIKRYI